jgi:hypothetical protein
MSVRSKFRRDDSAAASVLTLLVPSLCCKERTWDCEEWTSATWLIYHRGLCCPRVLSISLLLLAALLPKHVVSSAAAITRGDFPEGFVFGAGTSAYQVGVGVGGVLLFVPGNGQRVTGTVVLKSVLFVQVEGAWAEDGKKPSIWDTYTHSG